MSISGLRFLRLLDKVCPPAFIGDPSGIGSVLLKASKIGHLAFGSIVLLDRQRGLRPSICVII